MPSLDLIKKYYERKIQMNEKLASEIACKILKNVLGINCNMSLAKIEQKFAFDLGLPNRFRDETSGETAWSIVNGAKKYITQENMIKHDEQESWLLEKRDFHNIGEIIAAWEEVNYMTSNRLSDSINAAKCDTVYRSENIYQSTNCFDGKYFIYCNSCSDSEYLIASRRSANSNFCIRLDDSINSSNSFSVNYSNKIINSFFIQDCFDLQDCMFCSHLSSKRFCIANMQFSEQEYHEIKPQIVKWIMES